MQSHLTGPPAITLNDGCNQPFPLLPPVTNIAYVAILTDHVVMSTNMNGIWQIPNSSYVTNNPITFSPFRVANSGLYKFYVTGWNSVQTLAVQIQILPTGGIIGYDCS